MEEQWRECWNMATVSNILVGGFRSFQFTHKFLVQISAVNIFRKSEDAECPQEQILVGIWAQGYVQEHRKHVLPQKDQDRIRLSDTRLLSYPCQSRWSHWQWLWLKQVWVLWKIRKKHFWRHTSVFLHLLQLSVVLWTTLMVVQNKRDPNPDLTPSIPAQSPLGRQESLLGVEQQGLTVIVCWGEQPSLMRGHSSQPLGMVSCSIRAGQRSLQTFTIH